MVAALLILILLALFLEGTLIPVPITLVVLLCLMIVRRDAMIFPLAFVAGLLLDVMALRPLGSTSLFFLVFVFLLLLYQRKYEIYSYQFVMVAAFIGAVIFLAIFGYESIVLSGILSSLVGFVLFAGIRLYEKLQQKQNQGALYKK